MSGDKGHIILKWTGFKISVTIVPAVFHGNYNLIMICNDENNRKGIRKNIIICGMTVLCKKRYKNSIITGVNSGDKIKQEPV